MSCKKRKPSHFHGVIEIRSICFKLKRKPFSDSHRTENFDDTCILLDLKTENYGSVLFCVRTELVLTFTILHQ